jgi:hypothetical protein
MFTGMDRMRESSKSFAAQGAHALRIRGDGKA